MDEAEKIVAKSFSQSLRTESIQFIDEWAEKNRVLTSETSSEPGPWRNGRTPYLIEPMRCLSPGSHFERVVLMFGSQLGKSELGNNFLGWIMDDSPAPIMMVQPTLDMAKDYGRTRVDKMIRTIPSLAAKVAEQKSRDGANTLTMKEFPGGYLFITGANAPATLSSKPIRYLFLDEISRYQGDIGGEGDPCMLAIARQRTFSRRKALLTSTPTVSGRDRIQKFFNESDQRHFYIPCPVCGAYQVLRFENLKWENRDPSTVHYQCEAKGCRIEDADKAWMLPRGEWRSSVKDYDGNTAGFQLSSLYSPPGWFSWRDIVAQFLEAGKNKELLQVFWNTVLGEPWEEIYDAVEWEKLFIRRDKYTLGTVPMGGLILTAGADVQNTWLEVVVRAWGRNRESWIVGHMKFYGATENLADPCWKQLDALLEMDFEHESGADLRIRVLAIDTGGTRSEDGASHTQTTYNWCRRHPGRVMPIKGQASLPVMVGQPRGVDVEIAGKKRKNALKLYSVGVDVIKAEQASWLRLPGPEPGEGYAPGYVHFADDLEEEFFKGLCSESLFTSETKAGRKVYEWRNVRPNRRNEPWDCNNYARAASALLQIDRFKDSDWEKLATIITGNKRPTPPPAISPVAPANPTAPASQTAPASPSPQTGTKRPPRRGGMISGGFTL